MNRTTSVAAFERAYCTTYNCSSEAFETKLLLQIFYPHAVPFAWLFSRSNVLCIKLAREAVIQLAKASTRNEVEMILDDYRYLLHLQHASSILKLLRIRISGERVLKIYEQIEPAIRQAKDQATSPSATERPALDLPYSPLPPSDFKVRTN